MTQVILGVIVFLLIPALIIYDVYAFYTEENSTFSVVITDWYYENPGLSGAVLLVIGFLLGHWFAPARGSKD